MTAVINAAKKLPISCKQIDVSYTALVSWLISELALMPDRVLARNRSDWNAPWTHRLGCGRRLYK
jgi:hypothetical protein